MPLQTPSTVFESPHSKMGKIIELAWGFSTVLGILLFLVEIMIIRWLYYKQASSLYFILFLSWVKFYSTDGNHIVAAWVATGLLIPIIFVFIAFAAHFYLKVNFLHLQSLEIYLSSVGGAQVRGVRAQLERIGAVEGSTGH